jgi:hypothetical protein
VKVPELGFCGDILGLQSRDDLHSQVVLPLENRKPKLLSCFSDGISEKKTLMAKLLQSTFRLTSSYHQKVAGYLVKNFVIPLPPLNKEARQKPSKKVTMEILCAQRCHNSFLSVLKCKQINRHCMLYGSVLMDAIVKKLFLIPPSHDHSIFTRALTALNPIFVVLQTQK